MKRYFIIFLFIVAYSTSSYSIMAQSIMNIAQEEVTQTLDISNSDKAIILNMGTNATSPDQQAFYNAAEFDLLFRLKYNKATKDSWNVNWEATVKFKLVRIAGTYPATNGVLNLSEITPVPFAPFDGLGDNNDGWLELKINQSSIEDVNSADFSQVFVDYLVASKEEGYVNGVLMKSSFRKEELYNSSASDPFTTAIILDEIRVIKAGTLISANEYMPVVNGSQDPIISFEVTPKPREIYGKVGNFVEAEELACTAGLCYREEFEELVWKKIENAHLYDVEWVFIDKYDSETITTATEAFNRRRGVRIRTSDRHYLVRLGTELTYPEGRIFFRLRGIGKLRPTADSEVVITTGHWNYGQTYLHLGEEYENDAADENRIVKDIHEQNRNWQYATVFAEEGKYKKVMSYFDPSLRSTQTLTNFTTDASNTGEEVTLVEESFYDYEGRAVVQTIPAPLHTASLAHQSVAHDRVNFFANNDKKEYDNLANPSRPLDKSSLTAIYYSSNHRVEVDFSQVERFKHQDYVPIANSFAYTQVRYTNDGTGRVQAQSGVGEVFKMGGGKEVKTYYLNPSEEELRRLFGNELGDISHYKKVLTIDPNGQKSVAYIDQAGQTIATGLAGEAPEQLRPLAAATVPAFSENLIKSNQRTGTISRTEHTFYNPSITTYTLEYSMTGGKTSLMAEVAGQTEELCLACEYELEITAIDIKGEPIAQSNTSLPYRRTISGLDISLLDCSAPAAGQTNKVDPVTILFTNLPEGEYTIVKELRLTAGDATQISDFADRSMNQTSQDFRDASELAAAAKAKGDCLECTEVVEEDGTVTQLQVNGVAGALCLDYPMGYTPADFHNLVTDQLKDQCEADQNRYVLNPDPTNEQGKEIKLDEDQTQLELKENYNRIPLCILCVDENQDYPYGDSLPNDPNNYIDTPPTERDIKKGLKNSYLYDSYMRGIRGHLNSGAIGLFVDVNNAVNLTTDFGNPMVTDPFWKLFTAKVGTSSADLEDRWNSLTTTTGESLEEVIEGHIGRDDDNDGIPDLSPEEQREQSWLIFQGFYQSFKRAHLKVFYQEMRADAQCDPRAIDILLPELAGTENIDLAGITLSNLAYINPAIFGTPAGQEDQWEKTWLGYTGTANCEDWSENMTILLETKLGKCTQNWTLEEYATASPAIRSEFEDLFYAYCTTTSEQQPLANAFKKLYYSPYVEYTWLSSVSSQIENISLNYPTDQKALRYVEIYKGLVNQYPTSDLKIAFEVHFGTGALGLDLVQYPQYTQHYWIDNYGTLEKAELVRAYVESMIRAVSPTGNRADYDGDGIYSDEDVYSQSIFELLEELKAKVINLDYECRAAFYAMLSVPDCKTSTYQEVEVPASANELPVQTPALDLNPFQLSGVIIADWNYVQSITTPATTTTHYDPNEQDYEYMIEGMITPDLPDITQVGHGLQNGDRFVIVSTKQFEHQNRSSGFEVGFLYRKENASDPGGYHLYQHIFVTYENAIGNNWEVDKRAVSTRLTPSQLQDCHHFLLVEGGDDNQEIAAHLGNKSQKLYYDGVLINYIEEFGSITNNLPFGVTVNNHKPNVFPLNIGSNPNRGGINTAFSGKIQEIRVWRRDENGFNASNITSYRNSSLPFSQQYNTNLLAYWKLDDYTQENGRLKFKDYSIHNKDIEVALYTISPPAPVLPIGRRLYVSNTTTECITHERPTVTKFLHTCQDAYTFGDGVDLWGGRPLTPPTAEELQADCERITTDLLGDYTERLLVKQKEALEAKAEEEYRNQCFSSPFKETFTLKYAKKEYHYTLYYYDQAGNLVQTVPPEGVVLDGTGQNHKLQTKYAYNTLGQVVWQQTPDAGESKFWIDYYGRVKLSQNAEQKEHSDYAYSKFDELGRPYEVGKLSSSGNLRLEVEGNNPLTLLEKSELIFDSDFPRAGSVTLLQVNGGTPTFNFTLSERIKTFYDKHDATGIVDPIEQKNLKNRVAAVVVMEEGETVGAVTRYSYDIHGNVEKLWQQLPQETGLPEKTVEYNYDLLSGKVNEVVYEGGKTDEFRHRYLYDGDNRLTQVETSLDGYHWTLEASYFYYAHGPLARIETGQHNIQGTDYFYTLQGWIKGVNSIGLTHTRQDPGRDGYTGYTEEEAQNPTFNRDEYAYALNYYEGDYEAREGNISLGKCFWFNEIYNNKFSGYKDAVGGVEYNRESLYNGNIAAMATSIRHFGELKATQSMNYRYDQLHRIAAAEATEWGEQGWYTQQASYRTSYAYDGNGNIKKLLRNNRDGVKIDELRYSYDPIKKNRLDAVQDIGGTAEGLNNAAPYQYKYDKIGNLVQNTTDGIADIEWNIYGKVEKVTKTPDPFGIQATVEYRYDGTGNRIMKKITAGATSTTTTYLRDASGNVMAIYEEKTDQTLAIKEIPIYGSSRLGQYRPKTDTKKTALGQRIYEFSNHLGNVLVTLTDNKVPQTDGTYESVVVSASDYYPFGMAMGERTFSNESYRYGFNGQEQSDELDENGNSYTAEFWQYDARIGRRWNVDPIDKPWESSYATFSNNPIIFTDLLGLTADWYRNEKGHVFESDRTDDYLYIDGEKWNRIPDEVGVRAEQQLNDVVVNGGKAGYSTANVVGWEGKMGATFSMWGDWMHDQTGITSRQVEDGGQAFGTGLFKANPLYSGYSVATGLYKGTNVLGEPMSNTDIALEATNIVPWGKFAKLAKFSKFGNLGNKSTQLSIKVADDLNFNLPKLRSMQAGLSHPKDVDIWKNMLMGGTDPKYGKWIWGGQHRISGFKKNGIYYISEGNHRTVAALEIYKEAGNSLPFQRLIQEGMWDTTYQFGRSFPMPTRYFWGKVKNDLLIRFGL